MSQNRARRRPVAAPALAAALLLAAQTAPAQTPDPNSPEQSPSVLTSDTLTYDTENETVTASGNVEISTGKRRLLADEVRYDQRADKMRATGNVVLIEPNGDAIFGKEVEVTGDLQEGFVQAVGMLLEDDSRIAANRADRSGGNRVDFDRAVYSPCPLCENGESGPLWQIKARHVVLDEKAQTVTYRDARMELFGVPIAYSGRTRQEVHYPFHASPAELAAACDVLIVAAAAGPGTRHMIDAGVLAALGPTGVLVNVARGSLVDEAALVAALESGGLGGAALDVFEHEPDVPAALRAMPETVLAPHVGSATVDTRRAMADLVLANLDAHFAGQPLPSAVA